MTKKTAPAEISEEALDNVAGGVGLLLPAVQQVSETTLVGYREEFGVEMPKDPSISLIGKRDIGTGA